LIERREEQRKAAEECLVEAKVWLELNYPNYDPLLDAEVVNSLLNLLFKKYTDGIAYALDRIQKRIP
jgi:hypothetical protein